MPTQRAPQCPKPERLGELIYLLSKDPATAAPEEVEALEALEWLQNFLESRSFYHRKQQLKQQIRRRLLQEKVGDVEDEVSKLAQTAAEDEVINR